MKEGTIRNLLKQCSVIAEMSRCKRRRFGAIITTPEGVKVSDGYNGSIRGALNCGEDVPCGKDLMREASFSSYHHCAAVHAEINAIINTSRNGVGVSLKGCMIFLNTTEDSTIPCSRPCQWCRRAIVQAGITDVYYLDENEEIKHDKVYPLYIILENDWMKNRGKLTVDEYVSKVLEG